ncbi:hypothetical protein Q9L58_004014 [Maublancomyces gigas]|uniref:NADH dehydrogenase [ubiquinone] 1 beta subcomplex subunit 3 n=1 Tax=Discina gigas TaxID=1032678 RepID=A0ABR3GMN6_9PEZI
MDPRTPFDPQQLLKKPSRPDPWAKMECDSDAWRYSGPFTRFNRFKGAFPGLGIATVAFAGYCAYEAMFMSDTHAHHAEAKH